MYKLRKSGWTFSDESAIAATIGFVGAGFATIELKNPMNNSPVKFYYQYAGAGFGYGVEVGYTGPDDFRSSGKVWMLDTFHGKELTADDISGICLIIEASVSGVPTGKKTNYQTIGASATAMLMGIDYKKIPDEIYSIALAAAVGGNPIIFDSAEKIGWFKSSAKAFLVMGGAQMGYNIGAGILGSIGYVSHDSPKKLEELIINLKSTEEIPNPPVRITAKDTTVITIPGDVLFDWNEHKLKEAKDGKLSAATELEKLLPKIKSYSNRNIKIIGHTDNTEKTPGHNRILSENRAKSVWGYLVMRGIDGSKMTTEGRAATDPVAENNTKEGRDKNRRVDIHIMPN
jgi:outer membrane protein OmpA-like peptidoglycan-associated protein